MLLLPMVEIALKTCGNIFVLIHSVCFKVNGPLVVLSIEFSLIIVSE